MSSGGAIGTCIPNAGKSKRTRLRRALRQHVGCPCGGSKKLVSSMFRVVGRQGVRGVAAHAHALTPQYRSLFLSSPLLKAKAPQGGGAQRGSQASRSAKPGAQGPSQRNASPRQGAQQQRDTGKQGRRGNVPSPKNWAQRTGRGRTRTGRASRRARTKRRAAPRSATHNATQETSHNGKRGLARSLYRP